MKPEERDEGTYGIFLRQSNSDLLLAQVELGCRDWNDESGRNTECRIRLIWKDSEIEAIDWNFFKAFQSIRQDLASLELLPICYGASRRIVISGMQMDWDLGLSAYRVNEDGAIIEEMVCLFDNGDDVEPVSVEVQEKFQDEWTAQRMREIKT